MVIGCVLRTAGSFLYLKLCKPAYFVRTIQSLPSYSKSFRSRSNLSEVTGSGSDLIEIVAKKVGYNFLSHLFSINTTENYSYTFSKKKKKEGESDIIH